MALALRSGVVSQPISPELVLVDPELARSERGRLLQQANSQALIDSVVGHQEALPRQAVPRELPRPRRGGRPVARGSVNRFALFALLMISLMAEGVFVALKLPGERGDRRTLALPQGDVAQRIRRGAVDYPRSASGPTSILRQLGSLTATRRQAATTKLRRSGSPPAPGRAAPRRTHRKATTLKRGNGAVAGSKIPVETRGTIERKLLALVVQSPAGKLPPTLIDQRTGLAKNNLQAVCRRISNSRSFGCIVESAVRPLDGRVYVHYRPTHDGRGRFTWSPDRSG
jgi:hypothetical protein